MPPIPSRLPQETLSLISAAERRYKHVNEVGIPNLHKCTGPLKAQQMLSEEIRDDTVLLTQQIEELEMTVDDLSGEKNRRDLKGIVDDFKSKLDRLRRDTRTALLASKRVIDSKSKSNRDELLATSSISEKQTSSEKTTEDVLMKANSDVTDALRRTVALMQSELEKSVLSTQLLDSSTKSLESTSFQHDALSSVMTTSKHLITALEKSDWLDKLLILSAFSFFILVVLFIVKQRIVDKSIRIAFWWTRFIPSFGDDAALLSETEKGTAGAVAEVSSVIASVTTSLAVPVSSIISSVLSSSTLSQATSLGGASPEASPSPTDSPISSVLEGSLVPNPIPPADPLVHVEL
ncbi:Sec20-domain-containing protein [Crepidotus variabilis]|uniref:Sec20-domain-containing protein n=1 Tax=Crepidotus variabilis TaxID=179855 RepID=A0A9P6JWX5_9AGAR|nr:Sec20-domain-containing protein [Crepidotus variabilis]